MIIRWLAIAMPVMLIAQFSPGKLSSYHADLEGTTLCVQCHVLGTRELSDGCIQCHLPLKERIDAGLGYHAKRSKNCGDCHSDHNGREFELIYWPKDIAEFKHAETGYILTGKHRELKCNQCHTRDLIKDESVIRWAGENSKFPVLDRTFLGLHQSCVSCHKVVHREKVSAECSSCHNTLSWTLAITEYDHNRARFLLTGAHKQVACKKCHIVQTDATPKLMQLTGMAFDNCSRCHKDIHKGQYGPTCESCHTTTDWKKDLKDFDHNKTRYSLIGKHARVQCIKCHTPDLSGALPEYVDCIPCHEDKHYGQLGHLADQGECGSCHTVYGFKPTIFTMAMHARTRFELAGAHLATSCVSCHKQYTPVAGVATIQFIWDTIECLTCHDDVHRGQFITHYQNQCDRCHTSIAFTDLVLDHQTTAFPLDGKHRNVLCRKCHEYSSDETGRFAQYYPVPHECSDCHTLTREIR